MESFLLFWWIIWSLTEVYRKQYCMETIRGWAVAGTGSLTTVIYVAGVASECWAYWKAAIKYLLFFSSSAKTDIIVLTQFSIFIACLNLFLQLPPPSDFLSPYLPLPDPFILLVLASILEIFVNFLPSLLCIRSTNSYLWSLESFLNSFGWYQRRYIPDEPLPPLKSTPDILACLPGLYGSFWALL